MKINVVVGSGQWREKQESISKKHLCREDKILKLHNFYNNLVDIRLY
jgi:hypothetical protein